MADTARNHDIMAPGRPRAGAVVAPASFVARAATTIALLTGLWVAVSPWLLTLQNSGGSNVSVHEVIVGLAAAIVALIALERGTGVDLDLAGAVLGGWLIISPFLLANSVSVTAGLYWSSIASGAVLLVMTLVAASSDAPVRR